jgi:hypothetical protein
MGVPVNKDDHFRIGCEHLFGCFEIGGIRFANSRFDIEHIESHKRPLNVSSKEQEWYRYEHEKANDNGVDGENQTQNSSCEA